MAFGPSHTGLGEGPPRVTALVKPHRWNANPSPVETQHLPGAERKIPVIEANQLMCNKLYRRVGMETKRFGKKFSTLCVSCWNE